MQPWAADHQLAWQSLAYNDFRSRGACGECNDKVEQEGFGSKFSIQVTAGFGHLPGHGGCGVLCLCSFPQAVKSQCLGTALPPSLPPLPPAWLAYTANTLTRDLRPQPNLTERGSLESGRIRALKSV